MASGYQQFGKKRSDNMVSDSTIFSSERLYPIADDQPKTSSCVREDRAEADDCTSKVRSFEHVVERTSRREFFLLLDATVHLDEFLFEIFCCQRISMDKLQRAFCFIRAVVDQKPPNSSAMKFLARSQIVQLTSEIQE